MGLKRTTKTGKYHKWLEAKSLILLEGWARDGLTDEQIAHNMGISKTTLYEWKNKYTEIADALKNGKEVADYAVENALFLTATGYWVDEWEEKLSDSGEPVKCCKHRWIPGNTGAQAFWLKNRRRDKWRDKPIDDTAVSNKLDGFRAALESTAPSEESVEQLFERGGEQA